MLGRHSLGSLKVAYQGISESIKLGHQAADTLDAEQLNGIPFLSLHPLGFTEWSPCHVVVSARLMDLIRWGMSLNSHN